MRFKRFEEWLNIGDIPQGLFHKVLSSLYVYQNTYISTSSFPLKNNDNTNKKDINFTRNFLIFPFLSTLSLFSRKVEYLYIRIINDCKYFENGTRHV